MNAWLFSQTIGRLYASYSTALSMPTMILDVPIDSKDGLLWLLSRLQAVCIAYDCFHVEVLRLACKVCLFRLEY